MGTEGATTTGRTGQTTTTMTSNEPPITPCSMTTPIANQLVDDVLNSLVSPQSITSALANANSFTSSSYSSDNTSAAEDEDDGQSTSRTTITKTTLKSDSFHSD